MQRVKVLNSALSPSPSSPPPNPSGPLLSVGGGGKCGVQSDPFLLAHL